MLQVHRQRAGGARGLVLTCRRAQMGKDSDIGDGMAPTTSHCLGYKANLQAHCAAVCKPKCGLSRPMQCAALAVTSHQALWVCIFAVP